MADSTVLNFPVDYWDTQLPKGSLHTPQQAKWERDFILASKFEITAGDPNLGNLGSAMLVHGYTSVTTDDAVGTIVGVPTWLDRSEKIYFKVLWNAETANKNPTWEVTYQPFQLGDDFDVAIDADLDGMIPANTDGAAGDTELLRATEYMGYIDGNTLDANDELLALQVKMKANDSATNHVFIGLVVYWPRAD